MAAEVNPSASSATARPQNLRRARLLRAGVLLVVGLTIAFTATLHEQVRFDNWVILGSLTLIGAATLAEYRALRGTDESWWVAARAVIALAAAGAFYIAGDSATMAPMLAVWAALTAMITGMRLFRGVQPKREAVPSMLLSIALAGTVLLFGNDPVAVIGFFGAYAVIRGVFLGISAFDIGEDRTAEAATVNDEN